MRIQVIKHVAFEDLGILETMFSDRHDQVEYFEAGFDDLRAVDFLKADLLIILGGPISADDEHRYPFLHDEINVIRDRVKMRRPILGICLGAQLLALALGAKIQRGSQKEIGWGELALTEKGEEGYFHVLKSTKVFHWHGDTFTLPKDAVLQASTNLYPHQAFTIDDFILALQFHPEVTQKHLERWWISHAHELDAENIDITILRKQTVQYAPLLEAQSRKFFNAWLDRITKRG